MRAHFKFPSYRHCVRIMRVVPSIIRNRTQGMNPSLAYLSRRRRKFGKTVITFRLPRGYVGCTLADRTCGRRSCARHESHWIYPSHSLRSANAEEDRFERSRDAVHRPSNRRRSREAPGLPERSFFCRDVNQLPDVIDLKLHITVIRTFHMPNHLIFNLLLVVKKVGIYRLPLYIAEIIIPWRWHV
jgi:hypothetical protein